MRSRIALAAAAAVAAAVVAGPAAGTTGKGSLFHDGAVVGTVRRRDGRRQITYNGRPLYYYVGDKSAGQVSCQNVDEFGGTWLVMRPSGVLVR